MKKTMLVVLALLVVVISGCANISTARTNAFNRMVCEDNSSSIGLYATRSGLYFITFPLWTEGGRDVNYQETLSDLTKAATAQGYTKLYTVVAEDEEYEFPNIFWIKTASVSATVAK